jgi:hypothetical protein
LIGLGDYLAQTAAATYGADGIIAADSWAQPSAVQAAS